MCARKIGPWEMTEVVDTGSGHIYRLFQLDLTMTQWTLRHTMPALYLRTSDQNTKKKIIKMDFFII